MNPDSIYTSPPTVLPEVAKACADLVVRAHEVCDLSEKVSSTVVDTVDVMVGLEQPKMVSPMPAHAVSPVAYFDQIMSDLNALSRNLITIDEAINRL